jgi:ABC-2 type transport system permease protein
MSFWRSRFWAITGREFGGYFATPLAFVFIIVFLLANGLATFYLGAYFEMGQADLTSFFMFHPWLYLFFLPAISMRLWAEERRNGSIELLLTLPVPLSAIVLGKFCAAWAFAGLALALTFPIWLTVNYLGQPDNGVILASYIGSLMLAGGYLAIGSCLSALTRNQVIAFVISVVACFLFTVSGAPLVLDLFEGWAPQALIETIAGFSLLTHFRAITGGVIDMRDVMFFTSLIGVFLVATMIVVDMKKGEGA